MLRIRTVADRLLNISASQRKLLMTSAGATMDQLPPPPPGHRLLVEGQAAIPFSEGNEVFYNKVQEFNRDLSVHVIKLFAEKRLREKTEKAQRKARKVSGSNLFFPAISFLQFKNSHVRFTLLYSTVQQCTAVQCQHRQHMKQRTAVQEVKIDNACSWCCGRSHPLRLTSTLQNVRVHSFVIMSNTKCYYIILILLVVVQY